MNTTEAEQQLIKELSAPLSQVKAWIRLVAIVSVTCGVSLFILSIVAAIMYGIPTFQRNTVAGGVVFGIVLLGAVFAQVMVFTGGQLFKSAKANEAATLNGRKDTLLESLDYMATYFTVTGLLSVMGLVFEIIALFVWRLY